MKLTIVTAIHNRIDGLINVFKSLEEQTNQDFEHILVDDCSTEIDYNGLEELCKDNSRRHFVRLGFRSHYFGCFARNIGILLAFSYIHHSKRDIHNEWIMLADTDNYFKPNHIQSAVDILKDNPNTTLIATDAEWIGVSDPSWRAIKPFQFRQGGLDLGQFFYKTNLFRKYGYFFAHPRAKQRYDWNLIKKIYEGEYNEYPAKSRVAFTHNATFQMSYRKK